MDKELEAIYTKPGEAGSYTSAKRLYREARRRGIKVSFSQVEKYVAGQLSNTMFRRTRRKRVATFAAVVDQKWELDLAFYPPYNKFIGFLVW